MEKVRCDHWAPGYMTGGCNLFDYIVACDGKQGHCEKYRITPFVRWRGVKELEYLAISSGDKTWHIAARPSEGKRYPDELDRYVLVLVEGDNLPGDPTYPLEPWVWWLDSHTGLQSFVELEGIEKFYGPLPLGEDKS